MKINFLLVIVAYLGIACGASQSDYQIGVVLPLTGDFETDGQEAFTVIGLVQHQARTDGLDLSFVVLDNKSDPNQGKSNPAEDQSNPITKLQSIEKLNDNLNLKKNQL